MELSIEHLMRAVKDGDLETVTLYCGGDGQDFMPASDESGNKPVTLAARLGNVAVMQELLNSMFNEVEEADANGKLAIEVAIELGHSDICAAILDSAYFIDNDLRDKYIIAANLEDRFKVAGNKQQDQTPSFRNSVARLVRALQDSNDTIPGENITRVTIFYNTLFLDTREHFDSTVRELKELWNKNYRDVSPEARQKWDNYKWNQFRKNNPWDNDFELREKERDTSRWRLNIPLDEGALPEIDLAPFSLPETPESEDQLDQALLDFVILNKAILFPGNAEQIDVISPNGGLSTELAWSLFKSRVDAFAAHHGRETFYGFAIDASKLCLNSLEHFEETLFDYRARFSGYDEADKQAELKANTGDWYQGFNDLPNLDLEDFDRLYTLEAIPGEDKYKRKTRAWLFLISEKSAEAFSNLKLTPDFEIRGAKHVF